MKRITKLCLLLVCVFALCRFPLAAWAEDGTEETSAPSEVVVVDGIETDADSSTVWGYHENDNGTCTIISYNGTAANLEIPSDFQGKTVVEIGDNAFKGYGSIITVNMPDTITRIGQNAFWDCVNMKSIHLSAALKSLGDRAFFGCKGLTSLEIPKTLETFEYKKYASAPFAQCTNLSSITLEEGMTRIGSRMFSYMPALKSVTIPDTVTEICDYAFEHSGLESVVIGKNVKTIGYRAFADTQMKEITFSTSLTEIGEDAFRGTKIQHLVLPNSIKTIARGAFGYCENLETVQLPNALVDLGTWAFLHCTKLTEIFIPKTVTQCSYSANAGGPFCECESLRNVTLEWGMTAVPACLLWDCPGIQEITIPDSVTKIEHHAFSGSGLKKVTMSKNVATIEYNAFDKTPLTEVVIPNCVTAIGADAFSGCTQLERVTLSNRLQTIGTNAFYNCDALTSITIPKSLSAVQWRAGRRGVFQDCDNLETVTFEEGTEAVVCGLLAYCPGIKSITIPDSVKVIQLEAFDNSGLQEIHFGSGLTTIESSAFHNSQLKGVSIPDSVTTIGASAFAGCGQMSSVKLSNHLEVIPERMFNGCISLEEITIPDSVTKLSAWTFSYCTALKTVNFGTGLKTIEKLVFDHCTSLTQLQIPAGVTRMDYNVFDCCEKLTSVTIPDSVTQFGSGMFRNCPALTNVVLSKYLTELPANTFEGCGSLAELVVPQSVQKIAWEVFKNDYSFATIYIPQSVTSIDASAFSYPGSLTIYGIEGSYAQTFAEEQGIAFRAWQTPTESIELNMTTLELRPETSDTLYAAITPLNSAQKLTWVSDNPQVVTVSQSGVVTAVGTGVATVTAQSGSVRVQCRIVVGQEEAAVSRLAGDNRYATAIKTADEMKKVLGVEKFNAIIVASGNDFADALAGSYLSTVKNAPILLSWGKGGKYTSLDTTNLTYIRNNLADGGTVYVLGGTNAVPDLYVNELSDRNVKRLGGLDRFETNRKILTEAGVPAGSEILVCTGKTFADSLSASAVGKPILLVMEHKGQPYGIDDAYLRSLQGCRFTIIGGASAVSESLANKLAGYGSVGRLAGDDRFSTSTLVAEKYFNNPTSAVVAYAWNYPDGLCGGALAYAKKTPLILTMDKYEAAAVTYARKNGITSGTILGGPNLISDATVRSIFDIAANAPITAQ